MMTELSLPVVYQADSFTGEFIGQSYADPSPLEPGVWLIPGMATLTPNPKTKENQVSVINKDGGWDLVEDHRGEVYRTENGASVSWSQLGVLPAEYTKKPWPGMFYFWDDGDWVIDVAAQNEAARLASISKRDGFLQEATLRIAPLQDAVDLDDATPADIALLKKWKQYRVALNRIEQQAGYPGVIDWPFAPI